MTWQEFEPVLRKRLQQQITSQPESLLETDGGPVGAKADIILATLVGFDEQVDAEWRIPAVQPELRRPLRRRLTIAVDPPSPLSVPVATYVLQSGWARMEVDWTTYRDMLPEDVRPDLGSHLVSVLLVRYFRKS